MRSRCNSASSISAATWHKHASDAFKCAVGGGLRLDSVKELTITDGDECSAGPLLYQACPNVKVEQPGLAQSTCACELGMANDAERYHYTIS